MIDYLNSIKSRDPAAKSLVSIILTYPGVKAVFFHKIASFFFIAGFELLARIISQTTRFFTGIEIHPGAKIGKGVFIDHGMGVVIGETSEIGDRCLLYQGVTLGGTGKDCGKRHPTLQENVVVGAGAKVLGAIHIGSNTRIGAGSVVVKNVERNSTVVGIPGRVVHQSGVKINPLAHSALPDAEGNVIKNLMDRIDHLENHIVGLQDLIENNNNSKNKKEVFISESQNLRDKEIIDFLGTNEEDI